ncbi:DNA-binding protein [Candidatus Omnitrophota bacterium]
MGRVISYKLLVISFGFFLFLTNHSSLITHNYCYAEVISSGELIQNGKEYDGQKITYTGEAVGEIMQRKNGAWINVYDGENAIGIWMPREFVSQIRYVGSYKAQGDIIEVKGQFNNACSVHGGDFDIHAASLRTIKPGSARVDNLILARRNLVIILSVVLCLILILKILISR